MASKNTNKTIFAVGIVVVLGFLAYKLWPAIRKAINSGSGGGSTGGGAGSAAGGGYPYGQEPQSGPKLPSLNFGGGQGGGGGNPNAGALGGGNGNAFTQAASQVTANLYDWLDGFEALGDQNIDTIGDQTQSAIDTGEYVEDGSIPLVPTQNYDVNQNAVDMPGGDGTDALSYDDTSAYGGDGTDLGDYGFAYDSGGGGDSSPYLDYAAVDDSGDYGDDS